MLEQCNKKVLTIVAVLMVLCLNVSIASAQGVPHVCVFFDDGSISDYGYQTFNCTPGTVNEAYVVARNFNIWMVAIEFCIEYPPGIMWLADIREGDLWIGSTPCVTWGFSQVWRMPQNAFNSLKVVTIQYYCDQCYPDSPIAVYPNPISGYIRATRYPDLEFVYGVGCTSIFCPETIQAENTTWGSVKALYSE